MCGFDFAMSVEKGPFFHTHKIWEVFACLSVGVVVSLTTKA